MEEQSIKISINTEGINVEWTNNFPSPIAVLVALSMAIKVVEQHVVENSKHQIIMAQPMPTGKVKPN